MNLSKLKLKELDKIEMGKIKGGFFGPFRVGLTLSYRNWLLQNSGSNKIPEWCNA
nr:hypothetical protein [uncultured Chryseobacterium sp.]